MAKSERHVFGLDIGTHKICCVVGETGEGGKVHITGIGESVSKGLRKGVVVNLDATVEAVTAAVQEAELMSGVTVDAVSVGIAGGHIRSFNSRGVVSISARDKTVSHEDVRRVLEAAQAVTIPPDREILHVLPQEFVLDDQGGIASPAGLVGQRLEANVHIVTAASTSVQNLVTCANRAGVEVRDTVLEQLAVAESVLTRDEKDLGVALVDIGGGVTDLAVFERGEIWHTAVLPVGGDHYTNDLSIGLKTPIDDAERLKRRYGCAASALVASQEPIEVPTVGGGRKPRLLSQQVMCEILQPRAEEIFSLIRKELVRAGFERSLNAGVVLTGGGCLLPGTIEIAEQTFEMPVRIGAPIGVEGLTDPASGPQHAAALGLVRWAAKHCRPESRRSFAMPAGPLGRVGDRVRSWFQAIF